MPVERRFRYPTHRIQVMDFRDAFLWLTAIYIFVLNLMAAFVAWTLWIWRDGLLTPEETSQIMMQTLVHIAPFAILIDIAIGWSVVRFLRRTPKGDSSSKGGE
jgi:cytochrome bd-type quinol oxidase subunit 1